MNSKNDEQYTKMMNCIQKYELYTARMNCVQKG